MSIEHTLAQFDLSLVRISDRPAMVAASSRAWWPLTRIVLGVLLFSYLMGCIQDYQRVRDLRAEPSPSSKVIITKNEAWERLRHRPARPHIRAAVVPSWEREVARPLGNTSEDAGLAMMGL
jgi:hypothetical protein